MKNPTIKPLLFVGVALLSSCVYKVTNPSMYLLNEATGFSFPEHAKILFTEISNGTSFNDSTEARIAFKLDKSKALECEIKEEINEKQIEKFAALEQDYISEKSSRANLVYTLIAEGCLYKEIHRYVGSIYDDHLVKEEKSYKRNFANVYILYSNEKEEALAYVLGDACYHTDTYQNLILMEEGSA